MQLIVADAEGPSGRVGFVISRKALPRAVDRNRLRRQVRAMLAEGAAAFARHDLVVRVRPMKRAELPAAAVEARALLARLVAMPAIVPATVAKQPPTSCA